MVRDLRPQVEFAIHWSPQNVQCMLALVDTEADCSLIYHNSERFPGPAEYIDGYGGKTIKTKAVTVPLRIGQLPPCSYKVYVFLVPGYILAGDVL